MKFGSMRWTDILLCREHILTASGALSGSLPMQNQSRHRQPKVEPAFHRSSAVGAVRVLHAGVKDAYSLICAGPDHAADEIILHDRNTHMMLSTHLKGVWSRERQTALRGPPELRPMMARESPTFATVTVRPWMRAAMAVVPLMVSSMGLWCNCSFVSSIAAVSALLDWSLAARDSCKCSATCIAEDCFGWAQSCP